MEFSQLSFLGTEKVNTCVPSFTHLAKTYWMTIGCGGIMQRADSLEINDRTACPQRVHG